VLGVCGPLVGQTVGVEAHILLADAAQRSPEGKIHALGLGWTVTVTPLPAQAVVVFIKVPWDQANETHHAVLTLIDEDGRPVQPDGPDSGPVRIESDFETGRPAGVPRGMPLDVSLSVNLTPGLALPPGGYVWQLEIDGEGQETWRAGFQVRVPG
jgi:hypothetical protein